MPGRPTYHGHDPTNLAARHHAPPGRARTGRWARRISSARGVGGRARRHRCGGHRPSRRRVARPRRVAGPGCRQHPGGPRPAAAQGVRHRDLRRARQGRAVGRHRADGGRPGRDRRAAHVAPAATGGRRLRRVRPAGRRRGDRPACLDRAVARPIAPRGAGRGGHPAVPAPGLGGLGGATRRRGWPPPVPGRRHGHGRPRRAVRWPGRPPGPAAGRRCRLGRRPDAGGCPAGTAGRRHARCPRPVPVLHTDRVVLSGRHGPGHPGHRCRHLDAAHPRHGRSRGHV